jgi:hypothetical protein
LIAIAIVVVVLVALGFVTFTGSDGRTIAALATAAGTLGGHALGSAGKRRSQIRSNQRHASALSRIIQAGEEGDTDSMLKTAEAALKDINSTDDAAQ